jgi:hypothetical protein
MRTKGVTNKRASEQTHMPCVVILVGGFGEVFLHESEALAVVL